MGRLMMSLGLIVQTLVSGGSFGAAAGEECMPAGGLSFVCGPSAAEDLMRVPATSWIIGSGMTEKGGPGKLHLINAETKIWEILYPGESPRDMPDGAAYPGCPGPPDAKTFGAHGIAIRDDGKRNSTVLAVNHGREAIEIFRLDSAGTKPEIRWVGCVPMDEKTYVNSVAFLPDGGFVATKFFDPKAPGGFRSILERKATGGVVEWHPESGVRQIPGTDLSGANGIVVSGDGQSIYVAAWGTQELVRYKRGTGTVRKDAVPVGFFPDNLRWAPDGTILVAGQNGGTKTDGGFAGFKGWTVAKLHPETLKLTEVYKDSGESPLQNASVAIEVDGMLWIGTFGGDRVAYMPMK
jgi:hypothetical protein